MFVRSVWIGLVIALVGLVFFVGFGPRHVVRAG
jgi:hypothetical protein